ncbi:MAG: hypothetical protein JWM80_5134 [Cyanobacteria bacterium RYN_339]|nr:hypothetical protein [Cyanobacteria bacterium RYN_339]
MPAPVPSKRHLPAKPTRRVWSPDLVTILSMVAGIGLMGAIGGWLVAGLGVVLSVIALNVMRQTAIQSDMNRMQQENLSHMLLSNASPEDMAKLKGLAEVADQSLFEFLNALVHQYGGESVRGSGRMPSEEQTEAVAPGITMSLSHDLGWWYAKLHMHGETGRSFLHGEYTQWKGRGRTPEEAVEAVIKRCGASRQQRMIQEYAAKLVSDND